MTKAASNRPFFSAFTAVALGLSLVAHSAPPPTDALLFKDIQTLFSKSAYEAAILKAEAFERNWPDASQIGHVENLHGLMLVLTKKPAEAIPHFKKALKNPGGSPNFEQYVLYNLSTAEFESGLVDDAEDTAHDIVPSTLDSDNQLKLTQLKLQIYRTKEKFFDLVSEILKRAPAPTPPKPDPFAPQLEAALPKITSLSRLEDLYAESPNAPRVELLLTELVKVSSREKDAAKANLYLQILTTRFPGTPAQQSALQSLRTSEEVGPPNPLAIGVLIPLSGKFSRFGYRTLLGIEKALGIFNPEESDSHLTLYVENSGDDPDQAVAALNRLVLEHKVAAVIGPLLSKGIDGIIRRAQELRVPLLTLTRHTGSDTGDFVIHAGLTIKQQADEIARYAYQKLKLRKFAILSPRDKISEDTCRFFWDAVETLGGEITGYESYMPGETDFRQPVDKLSGLYYTEARARELEALAKAREENQIKRRTRKTEQFFSLKPIVDYEAVFMPDEPRISGQILPTFAYRDVDQVRFLGTSAWNSADLFARAQNHAEKAVFLDAFHSDPSAIIAGRFFEKFRTTFDLDPTSMEALAHDAADILKFQMTRGISSREELLARLKNLKDHPGVTGKISYKDGQFTRPLQFLTIQNGVIVEARQ